MIGGEEPSPHRSPRSGADDARAWRHPSEVGLASRGRADRRRSSLVAGGIVLGGLGLLVVGLLLGRDGGAGPVDPAQASMDHAGASLAAVTVVDDRGASHRATAVVLDRSGHLVLHASSVEGAAELWARTPDGSMVRAELVGADESASVAVLRPAGPAPDTARLAIDMPGEGDTVHLLQRGRAGLRIESATLEGPADPVRLAGIELADTGLGHGWSLTVDAPDGTVRGADPSITEATPASIGFRSDTRSGSAVVVDDGGRLVGIVDLDAGASSVDASYDLVPARRALRAAEALVDRG